MVKVLRARASLAEDAGTPGDRDSAFAGVRDSPQTRQIQAGRWLIGPEAVETVILHRAVTDSRTGRLIGNLRFLIEKNCWTILKPVRVYAGLPEEDCDRGSLSEVSEQLRLCPGPDLAGRADGARRRIRRFDRPGPLDARGDAGIPVFGPILRNSITTKRPGALSSRIDG